MNLKTAELRHFNVFGFIHLRQQIAKPEIRQLTRAANQIFEDDCEYHLFTGKERQQLQGFVERSPVLERLITDARTLNPCKQILGKDAVWIGSDGNRYVGDTGWHPDGSNLRYRRVKVLIYLDFLTMESGALRVIPGSHRDMFHHDLLSLLQRSNKQITPYGVRASRRDAIRKTGYAVNAREIPCVSVQTQPGDLVLMDQNVWHSSYGGDVGRKMFTLNYGQFPQNKMNMTYYLKMYKGQLEHVRKRQWKRCASLFNAIDYKKTRQLSSLFKIIDHFKLV